MDGWRATLSLELESRRERTVMARCRHSGPLRVQRPLYPENVCHIYVLHPPGGVVGGDVLDIEVAVAAGAHGLITTPAAGKFYRSNQRWAAQRQRCHVAAGGALEWLPQESILFDQSWTRLETRVDLDENARFAGWEIIALGRPAAGEAFATGACTQRLAIYRQGRPLWLERNLYQGGTAQMSADWGLGGFAACGTLVCCTADAQETPPAKLMDAVRAAMDAWERDHDGLHRHGISWVDGVLVCRCLGQRADEVRDLLATIWSIARPHVFGRPAVVPRIWLT